MLNLGTLCKTINIMLEQMETDCLMVKRAMGIRPDLELAARRAYIAFDTIEQLTELIEAAETRGVQQPPDVLERMKTRFLEVNDIVAQLYEYRKFLATRFTSESPKNLLS